MKAHLDVLLHALRNHQHEIVLAYFCLAALSWKYWIKFRPNFMTVVIGTAGALAILAVSGYISTTTLYTLYPNYFDHNEPMVASISWLWMHGHELYPNWATGDVYGSVYGPITFLINGIALQWSPSIFASKLPGVLSLGAALGITSIILIRKMADGLTSVFLLAALIMLFGLFDEYSYWNRPEPFLVLISVLALGLAVTASPFVAVIGVGALAGFATGLKLHGFIYTIPAAAAALARMETPRSRIVAGMIAIACAVSSALLPYLEKGASIAGHLRFLRVALDTGWRPSLFSGGLQLAFVLAAPIVGLWIWRKPALNHPDRWLLAALGLSVAMLTVIGAKAGGGIYYLLPLMPHWIYGVAILVRASSKTEAKGIAAFIFVSFLLAYGPHLFLYTRSLRYLYQVAALSEREKITELKTYLDSYPEAQIGVSDDQHYSSYFYRVLSVWNGRPLHVDFGLWMDLAYAGVDEGYIVRFIERCTVPTWILPLGRPFTKENWYNQLPLLSESFRHKFLMNYRQVETGQAYQVWECKS